MNEPTVFVIDDDEAVRDSLKLLLESHGMNVEAFDSAESFSRAYRPRQRACLVLDQHLGGLKTGLEFLASPARKTIVLPVILITGRGDKDIKARAIEAGVADYFEKPVDADRLVAAIDRALGLAA